VVEIDVGDDGNKWISDIGCVEPAAHPHLEHRQLNGRAGKILEHHRRQHFKEAGMPGQFTPRYKILRR